MEASKKDREVPIQIIVRKKGGGHGAHHGGAWKVAFADFMTAMFALFLVLWLVNQSTDVKSAIAGYFADPLGRANEFGSSIVPGSGAVSESPRLRDLADVVNLRKGLLVETQRELEQRIEEVPELASVRDNIEMTLTDDGLRIQLLEDSTGVFFETGSAMPSTRGQEMLAILGTELGRRSNHVNIEGHTDARPYSGVTGYTNWELSTDRANTARRIICDSGLDDGQMNQIRGLADRDLYDAKHPLSARNRRVTITMLLDKTSPPTAEEKAAIQRAMRRRAQ
jgi:chemotaxis protein MotB